MPTVFAHAAIGWSIVNLDRRFAGRRSVGLAAMALAVLPDVDTVAASFTGAHEFWAHRGITHSLPVAVVAGTVGAALLSRRPGPASPSFWRLAALLILVSASHGLFDALTDGGQGVAFFAPFSEASYRAPVTPIPVAPLSARAMLSSWGLIVLLWEWGLFGFPALAIWLWRDRRRWTTPSTVFTAVGALMWIAGAGLSSASKQLLG